ncbi:hypothetical protein V5O48_011878 [Marasmius crinis-equi]|uniref:F-box domain-containing protein n=1 Tax=Marasmius crinis-equi TaxID=585013 RepID=A0ABR3F4W6_9AGAR
MSRESDLARRSAEIRKFFRSTTSNKATVSQFLHDVEVEVEGYQAEINRLKTAIYTLENKRDRLKTTAQLYKSLLAPIHAMPSEILTMIFGYLCEENVLSTNKAPGAVQHLSMVCGRWRDIVDSAPSLWSNIRIDFRSWTKDFQCLTEMTERFLKKSGNHPLRLSFLFPAGDLSEGREGAYPALHSLVANCERWKSLSLRVAPAHFPSDIFRPVRGRLPLLTSLSLALEGSPILWDTPFDYFDNCPALRSLRATPYVFDLDVEDQAQVSLPWSQIRSLQMFDSYNMWAFPVLYICSGVETLEVRDIGGLDEDEDYSSHVVNSGIKTLNIAYASTQAEVDGVLQHTTLAGLTSLQICSGQDHMAGKNWPTWSDLHLQNFLQRSSCNITSLHLKSLPITDVQMLSLLRMIPSIVSLSIEEYLEEVENRVVTGTLLHGFAVSASSQSPSSTSLVPRLSDLKLVVHAEGLESDLMLKALSTRWLPDPIDAVETGVDCLRSVGIVVIVPADEANGGHLDGLGCFRDAGMRLCVVYGMLHELYPDDYEPA